MKTEKKIKGLQEAKILRINERPSLKSELTVVESLGTTLEANTNSNLSPDKPPRRVLPVSEYEDSSAKKYW